MYEQEVRDLANLHRRADELERKIQQKEMQIAHANPDLVAMQGDLVKAMEQIAAKETRLRGVVENRYSVFGEQPDHPALGVREYKAPSYSEEGGIMLAVDHQLYGLLALKRKLFEQVAPVLWPAAGQWDRTRIKATIKGDLSEWAVEEAEGESEPA